MRGIMPASGYYESDDTEKSVDSLAPLWPGHR